MIKSEKLQRYISTDLGEVCLADNVTELEAVNDELWQVIKALTTNYESAHAPKQEPLSKSVHKRLIAQGAIDPSVPVSALKKLERELQWGSSIKRLRRLFTDIIHEAEQEKQP